MKFLKIVGCAALITGIGYVALQSYKRSDIKKRIDELHDPEKKKNEMQEKAADRIEALIWLKDNLLPDANGIARPGQDALKDKDISPKGFIFSADNRIVLDENSGFAHTVIDDIASEGRKPSPQMPASASLYKAISDKIQWFINQLEMKLNSNQYYKNYFKSFNNSTTLTNDESAIIDKLKGAQEFYKRYLDRITAYENTGGMASNTLTPQIKSDMMNAQNRLRDFAKNYFNLTL